jgi:hypothetical protein
MAVTTSDSDKKQDVGIAREPSADDEVDKLHHVIKIGNIRVVGLNADDADFYLNFPPEKRKKMLRKVRKYLESNSGVHLMLMTL